MNEFYKDKNVKMLYQVLKTKNINIDFNKFNANVLNFKPILPNLNLTELNKAFISSCLSTQNNILNNTAINSQEDKEFNKSLFDKNLETRLEDFKNLSTRHVPKDLTFQHVSVTNDKKISVEDVNKRIMERETSVEDVNKRIVEKTTMPVDDFQTIIKQIQELNSRLNTTCNEIEDIKKVLNKIKMDETKK